MFEKQISKQQRLRVPKSDPAVHVHAGTFAFNSAALDIIGRSVAATGKYATFYKDGDLLAIRLSATNGEGAIKGHNTRRTGKGIAYSATALCREWGIPVVAKAKGVDSSGTTLRFPYVETTFLDGGPAFVFRIVLDSNKEK